MSIQIDLEDRMLHGSIAYCAMQYRRKLTQSLQSFRFGRRGGVTGGAASAGSLSCGERKNARFSGKFPLNGTPPMI
jgi:hypothetical protein